MAHRYYCRGAAGPAGHCDDRIGTVQCDHCIWVEQEIAANPDHPTNMYLTREPVCKKCGAQVDERWACCEVHELTSKKIMSTKFPRYNKIKQDID